MNSIDDFKLANDFQTFDDGRGLTLYELSGSDKDIAILERFYHEVYEKEFPNKDERESFQNMVQYLKLKEGGWYGKNNYHILILMHGGIPVGGSIIDYLETANIGVIEFLVISPELRGKGLGRGLLEATEKILRSDAATRTGKNLDWIIAEMEDPFEMPPANEGEVDSFDRALIWERWGYGRIRFPYVQPALSKSQESAYHLLLMAKLLNPEWKSQVPTFNVLSALREYMVWAMRILDPNENPNYLRMSEFLTQTDHVEWMPFSCYIGEEKALPIHITELHPDMMDDLKSVMEIYQQGFPSGPLAVASEDFERVMTMMFRTDKPFSYHLWALREAPEQPVSGMASFFTFSGSGYGGYVTLEKPLLNTGRLRLLCARIERQMIQDRRGALGWYIECENHISPIFHSIGFHEFAFDYRQPPLTSGLLFSLDSAPRLSLLYKSFGETWEHPALSTEEVFSAINSIWQHVYGLTGDTLFHQDLRRKLAIWPKRKTRWRE